MVEVSEDDLFKVLDSFQKYKSLGPDAWLVELFLGFFDTLGQDLLRVVEDSWQFGRMFSPFNPTFIALIPKKQNEEYFE